MLKNHYRCLNFIPRDAHHVIDIWTDINPDGNPLPEGIPENCRNLSQSWVASLDKYQQWRRGEALRKYAK
jgi:hypothetical protein